MLGNLEPSCTTLRLLGGAVVTSPHAHAGDARDVGSIPEPERSPGVVTGNPLQDSYLRNPMDRRTWQAIVYGVAKSWERLSTHATYNYKNLLEITALEN